MTRDTRVGKNDPNYRHMTCLICGTRGYALKGSITSRTNLCPSCQTQEKETKRRKEQYHQNNLTEVTEEEVEQR